MNINQNSDPITGDSEDIEDLDDIDIEEPETGIPDIATGEDKRLKRFFRGVKNLITGRNKAGKKIGYGLDLVGVFVPPVDKIRSSVKRIFNMDKSQQNNSTMEETKLEKVKRFLKQKSTQSAIALVATVVSAIFAGVEVDPEVLTQSLLGIITAVGAIWVSVNTIIDMFRDEDKKAE